MPLSSLKMLSRDAPPPTSIIPSICTYFNIQYLVLFCLSNIQQNHTMPKPGQYWSDAGSSGCQLPAANQGMILVLVPRFVPVEISAIYLAQSGSYLCIFRCYLKILLKKLKIFDWNWSLKMWSMVHQHCFKAWTGVTKASSKISPKVSCNIADYFFRNQVQCSCNIAAISWKF